jgi:hypothetical protein
MRESPTYQAILREGRAEGHVTGEQRILLRQGTKRFGWPEAEMLGALEAIQDIERLESLGARILEPELRNWDDLLRRP